MLQGYCISTVTNLDNTLVVVGYIDYYYDVRVVVMGASMTSSYVIACFRQTPLLIQFLTRECTNAL